jgi:hypothetical protein
MAWNNTQNIVKKDGKCWNRGKHKYCSYWSAQHREVIGPTKGAVIGFRCSLFNLDKEGYDSLPICNKTYGKTFDGRQDGTRAF